MKHDPTKHIDSPTINHAVALGIGMPEPKAETVAPAAVSAPAEPTDAETSELDQLRVDAEELGIDVDGRWGVNRLREEIDAALDDGEE